MGMILLIIALIIAGFLPAIGALYSLVKLSVNASLRTWTRRLNQYYRAIAVAIDMTGNVVMQDLFNDTLKRKQGYPFGSQGECISDVIARNYQDGTLTRFGLFWARLLMDLKDPSFKKHGNNQ